MSVNSRLKATKLIGLRKAFYGQRIPDFNDEPKVQEKQVKNQQSCISVFLACLTMTTVVYTWAYGRFIEIQSNLRKKKLRRTS